MTLALGPAHYWVNYKDTDKPTRHDIRIDIYSLARVGVGYNGDRFFGGISLNSQSRNVTYERTTFHNTIGTVRLVAGFRFIEKGFLKKRATDFIVRPQS
jgi:hypothetical protein